VNVFCAAVPESVAQSKASEVATIVTKSSLYIFNTILSVGLPALNRFTLTVFIL
jgi:hypothetical protein